MALNDFARRLLGYDPFGDNSGQPVTAPQANAAALAQPTLEQSYQDDLQQAQMSKLGQLGMLLMASGQQLTPAQRATILAQAPAYMDGAQKDAMTAAQARLYGMQQKVSQEAMARQDELRKQAPEIARQLGLSEADAKLLSPDDLQRLRVAQLTKDPLETAYKQAQIDALKGPKIGPVGQDADGNTIYGDQRTGQPINMPMSPAPVTGEQPQIPPGVNPREFRKQQAHEAAKAEAATRQQQQYEETQFKPAAMDYDAAVRAGIQGGAFGPLQANENWRSITSNSDKEALRQRVEQAEKRMAFELAKRASGGKLDSKGLTEGEFEQYRKQLIPLYSSNPQMLLDSFEKNYGIQPSSPAQAGKLPQGVTIRRLGD